MSDGESDSARQSKQNIGENHEGSYTVYIDGGNIVPEDNLVNMPVLN